MILGYRCTHTHLQKCGDKKNTSPMCAHLAFKQYWASWVGTYTLHCLLSKPLVESLPVNTVLALSSWVPQEGHSFKSMKETLHAHKNLEISSAQTQYTPKSINSIELTAYWTPPCKPSTGKVTDPPLWGDKWLCNISVPYIARSHVFVRPHVLCSEIHWWAIRKWRQCEWVGRL